MGIDLEKTLYLYEAETPSEFVRRLSQELSDHGMLQSVRGGRVFWGRDGAEFCIELEPSGLGPFKCPVLAFRVTEYVPDNVGLAWEALYLCAVLQPARIWVGTYSQECIEGWGVSATACELPMSGMGCVVASDSALEAFWGN